MAYCKNCGTQINDGDAFCPNCGTNQNAAPQPAPQQTYQTYTAPQQTAAADDTGSFGWGALGFCFPIVGLILFLVWKDSKPKTGKIAGKGALISVIISVVLSIISGIFSASMY